MSISDSGRPVCSTISRTRYRRYMLFGTSFSLKPDAFDNVLGLNRLECSKHNARMAGKLSGLRHRWKLLFEEKKLKSRLTLLVVQLDMTSPTFDVTSRGQPVAMSSQCIWSEGKRFQKSQVKKRTCQLPQGRLIWQRATWPPPSAPQL